MRILILFILSSCAISYYYKGKDVHKAHRKSEKEVNKAAKQFDKVKDFDQVVAQMESSQASRALLNEIRQALRQCFSHKQKLKAAQARRSKQYSALKISKKKKYTKQDKNYGKVKGFVESFENYSAELNSIIDKAKPDCEKPNKLAKKYDIKILNSNDLYKKFNRHKKELEKTIKRVKKSNSKFEKQVKKSQHHKKNEILEEMKNLKNTLKQIQAQAAKLEKNVKDLKKEYGKYKKIAVVKGTLAHKASTMFESEIKS